MKYTPAFAAVGVQVDLRVELLSIVARLSGYEEYNDNMAIEYVSAIHDHFDRYKDDTLIRYIKQLRTDAGMGYDAVMSLAVNLDQHDQHIKLRKNWQLDIDQRWTSNSLSRMVVLLNNFYKRTHAGKFFHQQAAYYQSAIKAFSVVLAGFNEEWYSSYYGTKPADQFQVIIGCGNGGSNYGPSITNPDGSSKVFAIMGSWSFDSLQRPVFQQESYLPTLVHEFNHSFINPSIEPFQENVVLKNSLQVIFDTMHTEMNNLAYRKWETVAIESLVRASVIRYLMTQRNVTLEAVENELMEQINLGFIWTRELVSLLAVYESDREKYPSFKDFYPVIIEFFRRTADNIAQLRSEHEERMPKIVSVDPITEDDRLVDTTVKELTIRFNGPMLAKGYSFVTGELGKQADPISSIIGFNRDNTVLRVGVKLEPGRLYEIVMTGRSFVNTRGYRLKTYVLRFRTKTNVVYDSAGRPLQ